MAIKNVFLTLAPKCLQQAIPLNLCALALLSGCTTTSGSRPSIWPTQKLDSAATATSSGVTGTLATTTKAVKGQFASMGTAVTSAYGKAKTAITSPFSTTPESSTTDASSSTSPATKSSIGPELYVMNGQLQESQGNYTKALDSYSKALEIEPKNPSALLSTARLYERQNEKDKALEFYQKASAVAPSNAAIFADMGNLHVRNGNLNQAKTELQKAVNLDPKNSTYRSAMAGVLLDSGSTEGAMSELIQVHSPAMANYQMAYLHFTRKNIPATQQYLGSALQIDPNLKPARDLMASMGATQNISQLAQQGQNSYQQVQGIYNQAAAISNNVQGLLSTQPQSGVLGQSGYGGVTTGPAQVPISSQVVPNMSSGTLPASFESAGYSNPTIRR